MKIAMMITFLFATLFLVQEVLAQGVGIGINTYRITLTGRIGDVYTPSIGIMNPSNYDIKARVYFDCRDCVSDIKIFGIKIAEDVEDPTEYFKLEKEEVYVPARTTETNAIPVSIHFAPKLVIKKYIKFYTPESLNFFIEYLNPKYGGSFSIPYFTLLIEEKKLNGLISADVVWSNFGPLGVTPSVGANLEMRAKGMPFGSFVLLVIVLILVIFLILRRIGFEKIRKIRIPFSKRKSKD
jgi:hypothetical protein